MPRPSKEQTRERLEQMLAEAVVLTSWTESDDQEFKAYDDIWRKNHDR